EPVDAPLVDARDDVSQARRLVPAELDREVAGGDGFADEGVELGDLEVAGDGDVVGAQGGAQAVGRDRGALARYQRVHRLAALGDRAADRDGDARVAGGVAGGLDLEAQPRARARLGGLVRDAERDQVHPGRRRRGDRGARLATCADLDRDHRAVYAVARGVGADD